MCIRDRALADDEGAGEEKGAEPDDVVVVPGSGALDADDAGFNEALLAAKVRAAAPTSQNAGLDEDDALVNEALLAAKVRAAIEKQRVSLASLERFTRTQEALFADAADRALVDGDGDFLPSYDWRPVPEGAAVPPGLDVKLSFEGKQTIARIPEPWQLRLVKDDRFVRVAVDRHARVADVVAELGGGVVLVGDGGALDGDRRFDAKLWRARQRLTVREVT